MSFRSLFGPKRDPHTGLSYGAAAPSATVAADDIDGDRLAPHERDAGYRRGRRDQETVDRRKVAEAKHTRRGGNFGFISALLLIAAVVGVAWMVLAYQAGSFAGGGAIVDAKVAEVTTPAKQAALQAVDRTGQAVQSAGQAVEDQGSKLRQKAE